MTILAYLRPLQGASIHSSHSHTGQSRTTGSSQTEVKHTAAGVMSERTLAVKDCDLLEQSSFTIKKGWAVRFLTRLYSAERSTAPPFGGKVSHPTQQVVAHRFCNSFHNQVSLAQHV